MNNDVSIVPKAEGLVKFKCNFEARTIKYAVYCDLLRQQLNLQLFSGDSTHENGML